MLHLVRVLLKTSFIPYVAHSCLASSRSHTYELEFLSPRELYCRKNCPAKADMVVSRALSDEAEAMNAIFGEGTVHITRTTKQKTSVMTRLPSSFYEVRWQVLVPCNVTYEIFAKRNTFDPNLTFLADFPSDYPVVMPEITRLESVSMFEQVDQYMWKHQLALTVILKMVFEIWA